MNSTIKFIEEGILHRLYSCTSESDARAFAELFSAQSLVFNADGTIEILILKINSYTLN